MLMVSSLSHPGGMIRRKSPRWSSMLKASTTISSSPPYAELKVSKDVWISTNTQSPVHEGGLHFREGRRDHPHSVLHRLLLTPRHLSRTEERRVGKECVRRFSSRWSQYH